MASSRVFVARMAGLAVFGPDGERIGKVRDVVVALRVDASPPRVLGLVVELVHAAPDLRADAAGRRHRLRRRSRWPPGRSACAGSTSARTRRSLVGQLLDARVRLRRLRRRGRRRGRGDRADPLPGLGGRPARGADAAGRGCPGAARSQVVAWRRGAPGSPLSDRAGHRPACSPCSRRCARPTSPTALSELPREAPLRGRRRARRRAAGRRVRGALRVRPAGAARATWTSSGPPTCWRRWPPTTPPTCCGELPDDESGRAAGADGARRVGAGAPAAELLVAHRGRPDDPGADHPAPGRDGGRGAGPDPQPRHPARAGQHGVRLPAAHGRPRPGATWAARTPSGCCARRRSSWSPGVRGHRAGRGWRPTPRWAR